MSEHEASVWPKNVKSGMVGMDTAHADAAKIEKSASHPMDIDAPKNPATKGKVSALNPHADPGAFEHEVKKRCKRNEVGDLCIEQVGANCDLVPVDVEKSYMVLPGQWSSIKVYVAVKFRHTEKILPSDKKGEPRHLPELCTPLLVEYWDKDHDSWPLVVVLGIVLRGDPNSKASLRDRIYVLVQEAACGKEASNDAPIVVMQLIHLHAPKEQRDLTPSERQQHKAFCKRLKTQMQALETALEERTKELRHIKSRPSSLEATVASLNADKLLLEKEKRVFDATISGLHAQVERLSKANDNLSAKVVELGKTRHSKAKAGDTKAPGATEKKLQSRVVRLEGENAELKASVDHLNTLNEELKHEINILENTVERLQESVKDSAANLKTTLQLMAGQQPVKRPPSSSGAVPPSTSRGKRRRVDSDNDGEVTVEADTVDRSFAETALKTVAGLSEKIVDHLPVPRHSNSLEY